MSTDPSPRLPPQVVYVSNDRSASDFTEYFGTMPWLAIPFADEAARAIAGRGVRGIPTLHLYGPDGEMITKDGTQEVMQDPRAANFPYKPKTMLDIAATPGLEISAADGSKAPLTTLFSEGGPEFTLVYFSAHWCGPCRGFTPALISWYTANKERFNMEIVFASRDRDASAFAEYRGTMPWRALPFDAVGQQAISDLAKLCEVEGIPTLAMFNRAGKLVRSDVRGRVMSAPEDFPWAPKPVETISDALDKINDVMTAILFVDKMTTPDTEVVDAFTTVARPVFEAMQAGSAVRDMQFAVAREENPETDRIREFLGFTRDRDGPTHMRLVVLNIPEGVRFSFDNKKGKNAITSAQMQEFIDSVIAGSATPEGVRG